MSAEPSLASVQPTTRKNRYVFLDFFRGAAILGVLPANIQQYGLPVSSSGPGLPASASMGEQISHFITQMFFVHKFITLFALLFGVGIGLIYHRCVASGRSFTRFYSWRMLMLILFGALHIVFIWMGDILVHYALFGLLAMWAAEWSPRAQRRLGIALLCLPAILSLVAGVGLLLLPGASMPVTTSVGRNSAFAFYETYVYQSGGFLDIVLMRVVSWVFLTASVMVLFSWRVVGLFLIGMSLARTEWFLKPAKGSRPFFYLGAIGLALGIPFQLLYLYLDIRRVGGAPGTAFALGAHHLGTIGLGAFYTALAAAAYVRLKHLALCGRIAAVGRMALTNYLLHGVFCSLFFYSYGLAMYGRVDRLQMWLVVVVVVSIELVISPLWMNRFPFGPFEWVWRFLSYGRAGMDRARRGLATPITAPVSQA